MSRTLPPDVADLARHGIPPDVQALIANAVDRAFRTGGRHALITLRDTCDEIGEARTAFLAGKALDGWDMIEAISVDEALS